MHTGRGSTIDLAALKMQVDADLEARLLAETNAVQYVQRRGFHIGKFNLLLKLNAASEVASLPAIYHLPGAPTGVVGLANRYGRVVPVVDLLSRWQMRDRLPVHPWLLVCGKGDEAVGLVVDSLPERMLFDHADVVPLAEHGGEMAPYVDAVYRKDERIWLDVNLEKLFVGIFNFDVE